MTVGREGREERTGDGEQERTSSEWNKGRPQDVRGARGKAGLPGGGLVHGGWGRAWVGQVRYRRPWVGLGGGLQKALGRGWATEDPGWGRWAGVGYRRPWVGQMGWGWRRW